jgi:hypothetical protein
LRTRNATFKCKVERKVDFQGNSLLPNPVMVGTCTTDLGIGIPATAQGVKATTSRTFETFLVQIIGWDTVTTESDAIAVVGQLIAIGGALPVTFPEQGTVCDDNELDFQITAFDPTDSDGDGDPWDPYEILEDEADATAANIAIVPLCDTGPGSVGWLDFGCGQNLKSAVEDPCETSIPIPAWVQTHTGNVNSLETEINAYAGPTLGVPEAEDSVLAIPVHDFTCRDDQADSAPTTACFSYPDWSSNGNNLYYHIPYWIGFKLDEAQVQGGDNECSQPEGTPQLQGQGGKVGCLKGWFVAQFDEPGPVNLVPIAPGADVPMSVTLIN